MEKEEMIFPSACTECGQVFDLSYSVEDDSEEELGVCRDREFLKKLVVCLVCRSLVR